MALFYGRRPVLEVLSGETPVYRVLVARESAGPIIDRIISLAKEKNAAVLRVPRQKIEAMFPGLVHQGIVVETHGDYVQNYSIDDIIQDISKKNSPPFLLILDSIEDPRNLGALIRTANGAGIDAVIIPKHRSAGITPIVNKTSAGAVESTPIVQVINLVQTCHMLKNKGIWIIGADASAKDAWYRVDMTCPLAIILGGEKKGIRKLLREECDFMVHLPMLGKIESLNVSVAGGILIYEALRQRMTQKIN